ncbi:hypothetical protein GCM10027280_37950 [Micromonospora polyrhachis]|uniref:Methylamine utilisation protein MauE domain-containing protein n=1 Tax=Micromonospora polyrhachis TaxID=1282883 RepID=A0A7W7SZA5_9ACTN|nr:MauE/DoxX family redox-associated membrane protein [Micromonospora polyrhachis]MBB4962385.1 hypothetical protein [Micromonospora polyrhachis]
MEGLAVGAEALLCVVFGVAASAKLHSRDALDTFARGLFDLRMLARWAVQPVAVLVAIIEAAVSVALLVACLGQLGLPLGADVAVLGTAALTVGLGFLCCLTATIMLALRRGVRAACPCFGRSAVPLGRRHVIRNSGLVSVAVIGIVGHLVVPSSTPPVGGLLVAVLAGLVLAWPFVFFDEMVGLFAPVDAADDTTRIRN